MKIFKMLMRILGGLLLIPTSIIGILFLLVCLAGYEIAINKEDSMISAIINGLNDFKAKCLEI